MEFPTLGEANAARQAEWLAGTHLPITFRTNELAGELGEVAELLLDHWMPATRFGDQWVNALADELGDVIICSEIIAWQLGLEIDYAMAAGLATTVANDYRWCAQVQRSLGLLCNAAKKMDRTTYGIAGGIPLEEGKTMVQKHLTEVVRQAYNLAFRLQILMEVAVARKFNKTSVKVGLTTLYIPPGYDRAILIP